VVPYFHGSGYIPKAQQTNNPTNKRKSTRYTWWNFFFITLFMQFAKVVNIFYVITGILQCFKKIQTNKPWVIFAPTGFVIGLGILKELLAEIKRLRDDKRLNNSLFDRVAPAGHEAYVYG
jgi:UDP-N-acetylglucosamine:LPS N-acetylglucosamine transferase